MEPTKTDLMNALTYSDGNLYWKEKPLRGYNTKKPIGSLDKNGYKRASFKYKRHMLHRLVWIFHNGPIGEGLQINHKDCNRENNRIENLEIVTPRENLLRTKHHKSGRLFGCYFNKSLKKWASNIKIKDKLTNVGYFGTEIEAHEAYKKAMRTLLCQGY